MEPTTSPSLQAELLKQKEELIQCLQEQLIGGRLRQAEMDSMIRDMKNQLHEHEEVTLYPILAQLHKSETSSVLLFSIRKTNIYLS